MVEGSQVTIFGKITKKVKTIASHMKKGTIPLKISSMGTCGATPFAVYTFIPTGGVI
jgi:hypothetical protein